MAQQKIRLGQIKSRIALAELQLEHPAAEGKLVDIGCALMEKSEGAKQMDELAADIREEMAREFGDRVEQSTPASRCKTDIGKRAVTTKY
ncbi:hypothetical protein Slin14017_G091480 [Septoria linicola]|nr:hypothetical protein Slin14017_G091480 [Septoria linicola]